jgi:hypothetical protein
LQNAVDIGEMLPYKIVDTRVLGDGLVGAVRILIAGRTVERPDCECFGMGVQKCPQHPLPGQ